jgi:hypothetical protein
VAGSFKEQLLLQIMLLRLDFGVRTGFMGMGVTVPLSKLHINETGGATSPDKIRRT